MGEPPRDWKQHLGRKVSIRYRLHDDPDHPFSEAIGVVMAIHDDDARIDLVSRRGELVSVAIDDILAAKVFPV
jgi:hypothetical protein